jgi:hypothetical protein
LLANAERYGVPKYLAVAHRILGEIAALYGELNNAEDELLQADDALKRTPAPLVAWRSYAARGRALLQGGKRPAAAREAFGRAAGVISQISATISEPGLRAGFLATSDVRQILSEKSS